MHKQKTIIGLVQMRCTRNKEVNLKRAIRSIERTANSGARIVCLPELFLSRYFCQGPRDKNNFKLAETIPGPTTKVLGGIARWHKIVIICSLFEKVNQKKYFNSVAVIGTGGKVIGPYRKIHIPSIPPGLYSEDYYFQRGDKGCIVVDTPYGKIAPLICYDQWFPEAARIVVAKGAQIIFYPTAIGWPHNNPKWKKKAEHEAWQVIQRGHAIANNVFVAAVNRVGIEKNLQFWGTSFVSDPYGRMLVKASSEREENLVIECDLSIIEKMRKDWPFLDERRIRYKEIVDK
ncbi:MAG: carbon-nitrogen hydrolase [Patescibacteria group bacterium]